MTFRILSFDGGGIRGLATATLLADLIEDSGAGVADLVDKADMVVGTSTGSLISLLLAAGKSPSEIVDIYTDDAAEIFKSYSWTDGITSVLYDNSGLKKIAEANLPDGTTMDSLAKQAGKHVAVCSTQLWDPNGLGPAKGSWMPRFISSLPGSPFLGTSAVEAALASAAAPIYFPPTMVGQPESDTGGYYVDGGLTANNPVSLAIDAVVGAGLATLEDIRVISFGTCANQTGIPWQQVHDPLKWGASGWLDLESDGPRPALPLLELALSMNQQLSTKLASVMLGGCNTATANFLRAEPVIPPYPMDDYKHISTLLAEVEADYLNNPASDWQKVKAQAKRVWS